MGAVMSMFTGGDALATSDDSSDAAVKSFHSSAEWQLHLNEVNKTGKLMVIDFSASWCGPCRFMKPAFHDMASRFGDAVFVKIDVDELSDVAQEFQVQAMPTFVLWMNGKEMDRIVGAKKDELEKKIQTYIVKVGTS